MVTSLSEKTETSNQLQCSMSMAKYIPLLLDILLKRLIY
jgi:hypothetical protein